MRNNRVKNHDSGESVEFHPKYQTPSTHLLLLELGYQDYMSKLRTTARLLNDQKLIKPNNDAYHISKRAYVTTYLPVFTAMHHLDHWAKDIREHIQVLNLSGVDLLKGLGPETAVALNPGAELYKTFDASELLRLKNMVLNLFK